jgi:fructose-1-phosphate kinase PfkB-like protein
VAVLTGSLPSGTSRTFYRDLLTGWRGRAILDVRGPELLAALEQQPLLVKPNRAELRMTLGRSLDTDDELHAAMREINQRGATWALVSQGKDAVWLTSREATWQFTPPRVAVVNPIGCGDCLAAGIAWRLDAGDDVPQAVRYGIAAAAENATMLLPGRLDPVLVERRAAEVKWTER